MLEANHMERVRPDHPAAPSLLTRLAAAAMTVVVAVALSACNTTEGAGRDIKSLGKGIEEAADDAKD